MRAEKVIHYLLANTTGVTALLADGANGIFPVDVPLGKLLPAITVEFITGNELTTIDAYSVFALMQARIQVTVITKADYPTQKALLEQVRLACNYQRGLINGVRVVSVLRDTVGPDLRDDALQVYTQSIDFQVTYQESTAGDTVTPPTPSYAPSLIFSDARNSQYAAGTMSLGIGVN